MFDLNDELKTRVTKDTPIDRLEIAEAAEPEQPGDPLDDENAVELHGRLLGYYTQELDRQAENRLQQSIEEDYYDNIQWTEEEAQKLKDRGQAPLVYNVIAQSINWIIGSEKRSRTDFKILPRGEEDAKPAEGKTKFLKYLSDVNRTPFHRSRAFEDQVKVGLGWLESGAQDEDDGEPIYSRYECWRNMLWDSACTELDLSDCRYIFRSKWVDVDVAKALFPERAAIIDQAVTDFGFAVTFGEGEFGDLAMDQAEFERETAVGNGTLVNYSRKRVRLIECWYRLPEKVQRIRGSAFNGQIFDENDPRHADAVAAGAATVVSKTMMRMRVALMTTTGLLYEGPSPYRHNKFPFIPLWGVRRGRDGLPYGVIRWMKDIQDDINKRASKAQYILSTNKVIVEEGAISDSMSIDEFAEEVTRPDAIIPMKNGKLGAIKMDVDRDMAAAHLELMSRNIQMLQQVGGVTDELMGQGNQGLSGIAIQRRQEQGSVATNKFFDNLRLAVQIQGEIELSLVEQFVTEQKQFRITNQRGTPEFITVNDGLPENDITRTKADFVVAEEAWNATIRQAQAQQLIEMLGKMPPQLALVVFDLAVELMDPPNREDFLKRIRAVNGQRDPDAGEPTPEELAQQQAAAEQAALQRAAAEAELRDKNATAAKKEAEAKRIERQTVGDSMNAMQTAMTAATSVLQMPTIAKVADSLLAEAGWKADVPVPAQGLPALPAQQPGAGMPPAQDQQVQP